MFPLGAPPHTGKRRTACMVMPPFGWRSTDSSLLNLLLIGWENFRWWARALLTSLGSHRSLANIAGNKYRLVVAFDYVCDPTPRTSFRRPRPRQDCSYRLVI